MTGPTRVKVCGLTVPDEARRCAELGAWGIGAILSPVGPRRLAADRAAALFAAVPEGVARIGVFVDAGPAQMRELAASCGLTHVQVHGDVDPAEARRVVGLPVIEAVKVDGPAALERARASAADLVLLDAAVPGRHGGTGTRFDWALLEAEGVGRPFVLAGGLTPANVGEAVARLRPAVVDVASGVEAAPGRKDLGLVAAFIDAVRAAELAGAGA